ncbi:hypothetical protein BOTBODRAFT_472435 [Botryobasidium botryosum FD-172 SS1]|uniref:MARVEL domain-containing protein n=1 Tax=Botryobasidium botryosum (strain FD-172 SS1) TaxID=930990 RepID=A0A067M5V4_BOTB1|nr:hypothetical protein BOTBODRAFT_472435 [Botryobasidium botryosum FD-172 SS1]
MRTTIISSFIALGVLALATIFAFTRTFAWSSRIIGSTANGPFAGNLRWWHSCVSAFITFFALIEFAISLWLIVLLTASHTWPAGSLAAQTRLICAWSLWTAVTSEIYAALAIMESTYRYRIASLLSHGIWAVITWTCWMAGAISVTRSLIELDHAQINLVYPVHMRAMAVFAWFETALLILVLVYLAYRAYQARPESKSRRSSKASLPPLSIK